MDNKKFSVNMLPGMDKVPVGDTRSQISVTWKPGSAVFNFVTAIQKVSKQSPKSILEFVILSYIKDNDDVLSFVLDPERLERGEESK